MKYVTLLVINNWNKLKQPCEVNWNLFLNSYCMILSLEGNQIKKMEKNT